MMFLISFGAGKPEDTETVKKLDAGIKTMGNWSSRIPNTWMLEARLNAAQIRDRLTQFISDEAGDRIFVARISQNWAGRNMGPGFPDWLKRREFGEFKAPAKVN